MHRRIFGSYLVAAFLFVTVAIAQGAEFNVSNLTEFQSALTTAQSNGEADTINVAPGTYTLDATLTYTLTAESSENYSLTIQGTGPEETVLDGNNAVQILNIYTESADDSNAHFTVRGLIMENGSNAGQAAGLSIHTNAADMTVEGCGFANNTSTGSSYGDGGGLRLRSQSGGGIMVHECEFDGNSSYYGAGAWAISYFGTSDKVVQFTNNLFINNTARSSYGGAYAHGWSGKVVLDSNVFVGNSAANSGGGAWAEIYSSGSSPDAVIIMTNNIFVDNSADTYNGGGAYALGGYGKTYIYNNTFYNNSAVQDGGGLYVDVDYSHTVEAHIYNNITWNNSAGANGDDIYVADKYDSVREAGSPVSLYNNLYTDFYIVNGNYLTEGNNILDVDPLLGENEHLTESSPCIDAGTDTVPDPPGLPSEDIDGENRIMDGDGNGSAIVDIGADEWASLDLCPLDPDKTEPGFCGCGVPDTDTDGDTTPDCLDECDSDPEKTVPGVCGCGIADTDSDNDGSADCIDPDDDDDGLADNYEDANQNGIVDVDETDPYNPDTDGDGLSDGLEEITLGTDPLLTDSDSNGIPDGDEDSDGDGFTNSQEVLCGSDPGISDSKCAMGQPWLMILLE